MIRIAVLEDNDVLRKRLIKILNEWDYVSQAHGFSGNQEFIQMNLKEGYDVLLADLSLNGENGEDSISYFVNERKENSLEKTKLEEKPLAQDNVSEKEEITKTAN